MSAPPSVTGCDEMAPHSKVGRHERPAGTVRGWSSMLNEERAAPGDAPIRRLTNFSSRDNLKLGLISGRHPGLGLALGTRSDTGIRWIRRGVRADRLIWVGSIDRQGMPVY
jgi:hypothetical protein